MFVGCGWIMSCYYRKTKYTQWVVGSWPVNPPDTNVSLSGFVYTAFSTALPVLSVCWIIHLQMIGRYILVNLKSSSAGNLSENLNTYQQQFSTCVFANAPWRGVVAYPTKYSGKIFRFWSVSFEDCSASFLELYSTVIFCQKTSDGIIRTTTFSCWELHF